MIWLALHTKITIFPWNLIVLLTLITSSRCFEFIRQYPTYPKNIARPKFIVQPEDQDVELGASVQLRCAGEASPHPLLFWYKEGHRQLMFAPSPPSQTSRSSQAKPSLNSPWPQAAALVASNSDTSPAINKLFSTPVNGDQFYSSQANSYNNNYFGNRIYVDSLGTLNIINATTSDNGYYACALISSVGSAMAKAKLTIRQSPINPLGAQNYFDQTNPSDTMHSKQGKNSYTNYNSKFDLLPPPVIKFGATNQTLPTNTNVKLGCEVVSQVSYKIQWFFNNQILKEEIPRVMITEDGALSLNNLRVSDSGVYTCVVTAADDQLMPIAAPFEPIDPSMLTSAPPIQQSTSHSTTLKVASPMNPNIQFYRMDPFQFPSSPGPAYLVTTNGNDAITIAWDPPAESGTLPIKEYVVEHYDTSKEHLGWRVIYRVKGKESLLIDGLSVDGSHFFVIRAGNSHGVGPSSAIAGPIRTVSGDERYKEEVQQRKFTSDTKRSGYDGSYPNFNRGDANIARERLMTIATNLWGLTPVSSTSIRLQWSTHLAENMTDDRQLANLANVGDFLEGYSIRYRALGVGESLLGKDPMTAAGVNSWSNSEYAHSLPLVTSYLDSDTEKQQELDRTRRDAFNQFDYSYEFNELKVVDHSTEHYTVNNLMPFTLYQFFVVPYYKEIDGVPSNILSAQTNEDRPSIAPPYPTIRPINNTAIRLLWVHLPPSYANGILRGYVARINRSDISDGLTASNLEPPTIINLPLSSLNAEPLNSNLNSMTQKGTHSQSTMNHDTQQYIVMHDFTNLTYKSFYSIQVAASTSVGAGPWSEPQNFIMDPKILSEAAKAFGSNDFDDVMSKSLIPSNLQNYRNFLLQSDGRYQSVYIYSSVILLVLLLVVVACYVFFRRNNQKVINWKKTLSEHFNNKFYMPAAVSEQDQPGSLHQQNIYDHQHHLIYSARPQLTTTIQQATAIKPQHPGLWANGAICMNGIVGSLPRHGPHGMQSGSNDAGNLAHRLNSDEQSSLLMNAKDYIDHRLHNTTITGAQLMGGTIDHQQIQQQQLQQQQRANFGLSRTLNLNGYSHHLQQQHQHQLVNQQAGNDYYSVINSMSEYEELDNQQRGQPQLIGGGNNGDRHQTTSSNSDTSCPSSVTRLLPNQNYTRDFLKKNFNEQPHEMVLQQVRVNDGKQPFATIMNGDHSRYSSAMPSLTPYATTNLMSAAGQQHQGAGQMFPVEMSNELQLSGRRKVNY